MHTQKYFLDLFNRALEAESISDKPPELYDPIKYILSIGERIRPTLLLMACEVFSDNPEEALPAALAIEMFHNFTLVHDDIMDKAPLRRGKETVYKKWNTNIAILAGDTMMPLSYDYILRLDNPRFREVLKIFNQTAKEVCEGQQFDLNFETSDNVTIDQYLDMIRLKTAVLIGASLKIGGIIGNASGPDLDNLYHFGLNIGMAFQFRDDLLDIYGNEDIFGKQNSGDIVTNKKTFLYLQAFELAQDDDSQQLKYYFSDEFEDNHEKILNVKRIYDKLNVRHYTEELIDYYFQKAIDFLEKIDVEEEKKSELKRTAFQLVDREF